MSKSPGFFIVRTADCEYGCLMQKISIDALARQQLEAAAAVSSGRAADTVYGGHEKVLRQTVMALKAGSQLAEHQNPGEATIFVLRGRVLLRAGKDSWQGKSGDLLIIPEGPHSLEAEEDAAILLTVAKIARVHQAASE
jgi:quercetin dioxygenase-like cupin family protein